MKTLVCVKRVVDYNVKIQVKADQSGVDVDNVKMSINPFDEIALEEAISQREKGVFKEVVVVTVGLSIAEDVLRKALAMGADKAILIQVDDLELLEPLLVAKILAKLQEEEGFDCVIMGKQAIDDDCNQTGQMLSGLLQWSQATFASKIEYGHGGFTVTREVDGGLETIFVKTPCVITTDLRLNTPRYIALPNILRAKTKPLIIRNVTDYGVDLVPKLETLKVENPPVRQPGKKYHDVQSFIKALDDDGVLR
ncbi:MAG: electron transfer flavoprotein subunit beta/FixA family protein [Pseudomonadota bacterium]|nr:electron transfer flavoprotein subunit beta/FixA family protein [Pseudomonadota bacterium]